MKEINTKLLICEWMDREFITVHTLFIIKRHSVPIKWWQKRLSWHIDSMCHSLCLLVLGQSPLRESQPRQSLPDNPHPYITRPDNFYQTIPTRTISTRQSPPGHYPLRQSLPDNPHPDTTRPDYLYQTIPTRTLPAWAIPTWQSPSGHYPTTQSQQNNSHPDITHPDVTHPVSAINSR